MSWLVKAGAAVLALAFGAGVAVQTFAQVAAKKRPEVVMRLGRNAEAGITLADRIWRSQPESAALQRQYGELALSALREEPLSPTALRLAGFAAEAAKKPIEAGRYITLAHAISRRDEAVELWLAMDAGRKGRSETVIARIDTALRTSHSTGPRIFPLFEQFISDPEFRAALSPYVRARRPWLNEMAETLLAKPQNATALADIFRANPAALNDGLRVPLLAGLAVMGEAERLAEIYPMFPDTDPAVLQGLGFSDPFVDERYVPVAWQVLPSAEIDASFVQSGQDERQFELSVLGRANDPILQKLLLVRRNTYRMVADVEMAQGSEEALSWHIACRDAAQAPRPIAVLPARGGSFTTGGDCALLFVTLAVQTSDGDVMEATVKSARLLPH